MKNKLKVLSLLSVLVLVSGCDTLNYDIIKGPATVAVYFVEPILFDERQWNEIEFEFETIKITKVSLGRYQYGEKKFIIEGEDYEVYLPFDNIFYWVIDKGE